MAIPCDDILSKTALHRQSRGDHGEAEAAPRGGQPPAPGQSVKAEAARGVAGRLCALAEFLPPTDEALIAAFYADGRAVVDLARLTGAHPRAVRRRVDRLTRRLNDPVFASVIAQRGAWREDLALVATLCIVEGRPVREVARRVGASQHRVRSLRAAALALAGAPVAPARPMRWRTAPRGAPPRD